MDISCSFATSPDTPEHVEIAERLGYRRAWLYDTDIARELEAFMGVARTAVSA